MEEIHRADPHARSRARTMIIAVTVIGSVLIGLTDFYRSVFVEWIARDLESRSKLVALALAVAFVLPTLGFAAYFWRLGDRIVRAERFPVPRSAVIRDTVVLRGDAARRRGRMTQVVAASLALLAAGFCIFLWRFLTLLESNAL